MGWMTADNASNNSTAICGVAKTVNINRGLDEAWVPLQHYIR